MTDPSPKDWDCWSNGFNPKEADVSSDKLSDRLREASEIVDNPEFAKDLEAAADILDFVCGNMQSHSLHMSGYASYRMRGGWPLSSVRAMSAEEALMKCVEMVKESSEK